MDDDVTVPVRMSEKTKAMIDRLAASLQRDPCDILNEAIAEFIERLEGDDERIRRGLAEAKAGTFVTEEDLKNAFARWER
jgi:predicted transcriptional regulator